MLTSTSNLKSFELIVHELFKVEVLAFWLVFSCSPIRLPPYELIEAFQILNGHKFKILRPINIKLWRTLKGGLSSYCEKLSIQNFYLTSLKTKMSPKKCGSTLSTVARWTVSHTLKNG